MWPSVHPVLIVVAGLLLLAACGDDDDEATDNPTDVVGAYIDAYNAGDVDAAVALFADDAVITEHPMAQQAEGPDEIRALVVADIEQSDQGGDSYEISNLQVTGSTTTWDHRWKSDGGNVCTATGHEAVIEDGKIITWVFPTATIDCTNP